MVEWLAGNRIRGTNAERTSTTGFNPVAGVTGGWKELGRTTLSNTPTGTADYTAGSTSYGTGDSGSAVDLQTQVGSTLGNSWTLRFKLTMTSKANNLIFMVQDINTIDETTTRDGIGLRQTASTSYYDLEGCNGTAPTGGQYDHRFTTTPAIDTKYVQITRVSETSASIQFWNSTYTTVSESSDNIPIADITNLRYFVIYNNGSAFTIDEVSFWNNSASTGASDTIDVSSLADKRYLMFLLDSRSNGTAISTTWKANGSTGNEYSFRRNHDGTETDANTQPSAATSWTSIVTNAFGVGYAANMSGKEKLFLEHEVYQNTAGANAAPTRTENAFKWSGTDVIDQLTMHNSSSGDIVSGSELVVLGWDEDDTHTTNFWEELASVDWSSGGSISSGTFTPKKYLCVQGWYKNAADTGYLQLRVGNSTVDPNPNYANRYNHNGTIPDPTPETGNNIILPNVTNTSASGANGFFNSFIINNASNEKLVINHHVLRGGSGAGSAPDRVECVSKWANTSNQINIIEMLRNTNNFTAGQIKVWGSD